MGKFAKNNWPIVLLSVLTVSFEIFYQTYLVTGPERFNILGPANELSIFRYIPVAVLAYSIVFKGSNHYQNFVNLIKISIPVLSVVFLAAFILLPQRVNSLTQEDGLIENLSALLLFFASAIMLASFFRIRPTLRRKKRQITKWLLLILAIVFFILGMEEISWMQRILDVRSTGYFLEYNWQQETNLHNFNSTISNDLYYVGGFILLTLAPLYNKSLRKTFRKLDNIQNILPEAWLVIPFILMSGLTGSSIYAFTLARPALFIFSVVILAYIILQHLNHNQRVFVFSAILSLFILVVMYFTTFFYDYSSHEMRLNAAGEFRELLISIGVFTYAISVYARFFHPKLAKHTDKQPTYK